MGTALSVDRMNFGGQFASGEGVQLDCLRVSVCKCEGWRRTYIWGKDDWRRREIQLGYVERLVQEVGRVELVEGPDSWLALRRHLLRSWLSRTRPHLHACHALRDATHTSCTRGRRGAICIGRLEARSGGSRRAVGLGGTIRGRLRLCVLAWVPVASSHGLRSAELAAAWKLAPYSSIRAAADIEGLGSVGSLLLLGLSFARLLGRLRWRRASGVRVGLAIISIGDLLALLLEGGLLAVVVGCRHDRARGGEAVEGRTMLNCADDLQPCRTRLLRMLD